MDITPFTGTYRREGVVITVTRRDDGTGHMRYEFVDGRVDGRKDLFAAVTSAR